MESPFKSGVTGYEFARRVDDGGGVNGELFLASYFKASYFKASYFGELFLCKLDYLK